MNEKYYKVLGPDGRPCHGGSGKWNLPNGDKPGEWMPYIADIVPCERGYHACRPQDLINWLGDCIYDLEIEPNADVIIHANGTDSSKIVTTGRCRLLRLHTNWNEFTARLFAADVAERQLERYESRYPQDKRVRQCIETVRRFAHGEATEDDLSAAWSAAWSAVGSAVGSAAESAAARSAAESAARSSAMSAAWSAALSAAWNAARTAAVSAAESAEWSAVGSAAESAAESAERQWQTELLMQYITGVKP